MGRLLTQQKRGKGGPGYRVPKPSFRPRIDYRNVPGKVVDILKYRLMNAPLAKILYEDDNIGYLIAPSGMRVGESVENIVQPLSDIPIGSPVFGMETTPNSGPKLCRTSGSFAILLSKDKKNAVVQLPSRKTKKLSASCKAMIGFPAGEGRTDKPWAKAGKRYHARRARGKPSHRTSGIKMNAVDHPFGGQAKKIGKSKSTSRNASPGQKVGSISSKRTGRKKKK